MQNPGLPMHDLRLLRVILRELLGRRTLARRPESDLVMVGQEETAAYALAGQVDPDFAAVNLLHAVHISHRVQGLGRVVDLACGPATLLIELARFNPGVSFQGIELSPEMIAIANRRIGEAGLSNVRITQADITQMHGQVATRSADAVISSVALHHLPSLDHLRRCFREVARILKPGGSIYITDFARFKAESSVTHFAYLNDTGDRPDLACYYKDYEQSLHAAFLLGEFDCLRREELNAFQARIAATFPVPFFFMIHTAAPRGGSLPIATARALLERHRALPASARKRLAQLRFFLRWGGLSDQPFRQLLNDAGRAGPAE